MLAAVDPAGLRVECGQRIQKIRNAETAVGPPGEVLDHSSQVVAVVANRGASSITARLIVASRSVANRWSAGSGTEPSRACSGCRSVTACFSRSQAGSAVAARPDAMFVDDADGRLRRPAR